MLYSKIKSFSKEDIVVLEQKDRQFRAIKKLYENKLFSDEIYLFLVLVNALICYQLSGKGEEYWEEFSDYIMSKESINFSNLESFFVEFLNNCKNNKRLVNIKLKRVKKICKFYKDFSKKTDFYYKNMKSLNIDLARVMKQDENAKTIVFAVKMSSYAGRNVFGYIEYFPNDVVIPIDSRLKKIYRRVKGGDVNYNKKDIEEYYKKLSVRANIPPLHLDTLLWLDILN